MFWEDELFTLYISAGKWSAILDALKTGADQHPPSFYFLTHLITSLFGATHLTVRAASIFGFWLMSVCLYALGRRYLSPTWSVVLLLFPCATGPYYWYACDARGYALMCGFAAVAVLCWVMATLGEMRPITVPGLFISLAASGACHYYGIFVVGPLALGEAVRCARTRKLDVVLWAAFSGALLPPLLFVDLIRNAKSYSNNFWAKPSWLALIWGIYPRDAFIVVALLVGVAFAFSRSRSSTPPRPVTLPFVTSMVSLALLPFVILVLAEVVTHSFTERYALVSSIGIFVSICFALARLTSERTAAAAGLVILEVLFFGTQLVDKARSVKEELALARTEYRTLSREAGHGEFLAISEVAVFQRLSFYGPISFARRISYLADANREIRYSGFDTVDRGLLALRSWFPINTQPYGKYLREHDHFLVYGYQGPWAWLTYELYKIGAMRLRWRIGSRTLFDYTRDGEVPPDVPPSPTGDQTTMLDRLPDETESVCRAFLSPSSCIDLR
jgi:hypothetical protein